METKAVQLFFNIIDAHPLSFACSIEYLHRSKFASDSIRFRPLAVKRNPRESFRKSYLICSHDIDHSFFLSASCTNWYTPASAECRVNVIRSLHLLWQNARGPTWSEGRKSHEWEPSLIALCTVDERASCLKKKTKIREKYASQRELHPRLRRWRQWECACIESPCTRCTVLMPGAR